MKSRLCIVSFFFALAVSLVSAFSSREFSIVNPTSRLRLAGTLTIPDSAKAKALIVMATGSGTQDRDETILGHKPFKAIAGHLSTNGYAVIRMDDRGAGGSEAGDIASVTTFDFATDIAAAISAADSLLGYDTPKGVFGHSEGGIIACNLAAHNSDIDFIITFGSPAFRGDSVLMRQVRETCTVANAADQFENLYPSLRRRYDLAMSQGIQPLIEAQILAEFASSQPEIAAIPQVRERAEKEVKALCSPWMRTFLRLDPADDISKIKIPWLAVNGSLDRQITPDNLELITRICPDADTLLADRLNHIMLPAITGSPEEYKNITGDADQKLLDDITRWLDRRIAQSR